MDVRLFLLLMRSLIPRWNFFDTVGHHFEIDVRTTESDAWRRLDFTRRRKFEQLFFNPDVNFAWLQSGLVEQFATDVQRIAHEDGRVDDGEIERLATFPLIRTLVKSYLGDARVGFMQFKIVASSGEIERESEIDVFVSDWLTVTPP